MKNLLKLLLIMVTTVSFGQDIYINQKWKEDVSNVGVGDTITLQIQYIDIAGDAIDPFATLVQIDWEYNMDLLELQSHEFIAVDNPNATKNFNSWTNYNFKPNDNYGAGEIDLSAQYLGERIYDQTNGWGINRITLQDTEEIVANTDGNDKILVEVKYVVKDIGNTSYTDYSNLITLNWVNLYDNRNGNRYSVFADPLSLDLENVAGSVGGAVTFKLQTPNSENISDYRIHIEPKSQYLSNNSGESVSNPIYINGTLNASGEFTTTDLRIGTEYIVNVHVTGQWDDTTQTSVHPQWLDDVVTVSDVMQVFLQAIGTNPDGSGNHFEYNIQKQLANVDGKNGRDVNFDDSYALLAHIAGILENGTTNQTASDFYPITSFNNGSFNWSGFYNTFGAPINSEEDWLNSRSFTLTDSEPVLFTMAHGLMGDADLSHSTTPPLNNDTELSTMAKGGNINLMKSLPQEDIDLDIVSQLVGGKVELEINLTKEDLAGMQFNINYDTSILTFDNIIFNTGNEMTNFAKKFDNGRINFGSINLDDKNVKTGKPFKLVFTPKVLIQNTVGLVTFRVTDAVKHNGTKVNLNLR